jgi:hypothetical protein
MDINNFLFLHKSVYDYLIDYEYTIIAYFNGITNINNEILNILNRNDEGTTNNLITNIQFYKYSIKPLKLINLTNKINVMIGNEIQTFHSSSPSFLFNPFTKTYIMNMRYVNYTINKDGSYQTNRNVITVNKYLELNPSFAVIPKSEKVIELDYVDHLYVGVEDIKIYYDVNNNVRFLGTGFHQNNKIGIVGGLYNTTKLQPIEYYVNFKSNQEVEKNWVHYPRVVSDKIKNYKTIVDNYIYKWHPLTICELVDDKLNKIEEIETPIIFKHFRGSSNGYRFNGHTWFVVHFVHFDNPRKYYHVIVSIEDDTNELKYSYPITFEKEHIEFCLGIVVNSSYVMISYSTWDSSSKIAIYDKNIINQNMVGYTVTLPK